MKQREIDERIWQQVALIPPGKVASYGQIAKLAGFPRGARMVGRSLGRAPAELELPWHRVIRSGGQIAMRPGSNAFKKQAQRLIEEGVAVVGGKISMNHFQWEPSLDELLWGPGLPDAE